MFSSLMNRFHWLNAESVDKTNSPKEQYQRLSQWAAKARSVNPRAFDEWILWLRSDTEWESSHLDSRSLFTWVYKTEYRLLVQRRLNNEVALGYKFMMI